MRSSTQISKLKYGLLLLVGIAGIAVAADHFISGAQSSPIQQSQQSQTRAFKIQPELWPLSQINDLDISQIQAEAAILINEDTGEILAERQSQVELPMASTTKIMTAAIVLEFARPDSVVTVPQQALDDLPPDSALMGISAGEQYTVEELLYGLMLNSGNDAANVLALAVSGSEAEFVQLMNAKAAQLGLQHTQFTNPAGLDHANHYSTAQDLAAIAHYARSFPLFNQIVATPAINLHYTSQHKQLYLENLNSMVSTYAGATGIKPGNTGQAGNCLVASATRNGVNLIGVLLNTPGRNTNMAILFDLGFERY